MTLNEIGLWITGLGDDTLPAPQELVGTMSADERARLVAYLEGGMRYRQYMGLSWCRFGCGVAHLGSRSLTDGTWIWPEGLAHYVREYGIVLPGEFVTQALVRGTPVVTGWSGPGDRWHLLKSAKERGVVDDTAEPANPSFWIQWCAARRSQGVLAMLRRGRATASALARAESAQRSAKFLKATVRKYGLGDDLCLWRGCTSKALRGLHICAGHFPGGLIRDPRARFAREFYKLLTVLSDAHGVKARFPRCYQSPFESWLRSNISRIRRYFFGAPIELVGSDGQITTLGRRGLLSWDTARANQRRARRAQGRNR